MLDVAIRDPLTLDPMHIQDPGSVLIARQLYEGLTRWDPIAEKVRPGAAESWTVSEGGRRFTFHLRPGMSFHDGAPVTARSFIFAFDRIALKSNASDLAYALELVEGFALTNKLGESDHLAGLSAPDPSTLVITLSEPFYDFPAVLTHPALVPLSRAAVAQSESFLSAPVGNGPFQMAAPWSPGESVVLRSFPGFIRTPDLDGIRFIPFPDAAASWLRFEKGELDVAEVPAGQIESAEQEFSTRGFQPFLSAYYFGFNLRAPGLRSLTLRRAISRAIDRERIAATIYKGTMRPARGVVPWGMPGFQVNSCLKLCDHSLRVARRLVARVPGKERAIRLEYTRGDPHGKVARSVRENLEAAGLEVELRPYAFGEYLQRLRDAEQSFYRFGWIAEYPVADAFLAPLFREDSPENHAGFRSAKVDRLIAQARAEPSPSARAQLYGRAEKIILSKVAVIPIGSFVTHWAAQRRVKRIVFDQMGGFDAAVVSLSTG